MLPEQFVLESTLLPLILFLCRYNFKIYLHISIYLELFQAKKQAYLLDKNP